jgi:hypothetical protein
MIAARCAAFRATADCDPADEVCDPFAQPTVRVDETFHRGEERDDAADASPDLANEPSWSVHGWWSSAS